MSGWWGEVTGDAKKAFVGGFDPLPEGEIVTAEVTKAEIENSEYDGDHYKFTWKINNGKFKNRLLFHKVKALDADPVKAEKGQQMLMLMFNLFNVKPTENAPTEYDLAPMIGRVATLKVGKWKKDGREGNIVREVHDGKLMQSAMSRNQDAAIPDLSDVPF
jgi:hypothetical protein